MRTSTTSLNRNRVAARDRYRRQHAMTACSSETRGCEMGPKHLQQRKHLERSAVLQLAERIAGEHFTSLEEVLGPSHVRRISFARQAIWSAIRAIEHHGKPVFSFSDIGMMFDRDHRTVMSGIEAHREREAKASRKAA